MTQLSSNLEKKGGDVEKGAIGIRGVLGDIRLSLRREDKEKKTMKRLALTLLVVSLFLWLGATSALAEGTKEKAPTKVPTVVLGVESGGIDKLFESLIPAMEKELGIKVELKTWPLYQSYETLMLMLTSGDASVDVCTFLPRWSGDMAEYFVDLSKLGDFQKDFHVKDVVPGFRDGYMNYKGRWVGVTYDGDTLVIMYRSDLLEDPKEMAAFKAKYGYPLAPPKTEDQYNDIAEFFTRPEKGLWGHAMIYKRTWENTTFFYQYLFNRGGQLWDKQGNARIGEKEGQEAILSYLKGRAWVPPGYNEVAWEEQRRLFFQGKVAMAWVWTDGPKGAADPSQSIEQVRKNFRVSSVPGPYTYMFGGRVLGIPNKTPGDKKVAYKVLQWLFRPELTTVLAADPATWLDPWMYQHFKDPSIYKQMAEVGAAESFVKAAMEGIEKGIPHVNIKFGRRYEDALCVRLAQAASGEMDGVAAIKAAQDDWDRITAEIGKDIMVPEMVAFLKVLESKGYPVK